MSNELSFEGAKAAEEYVSKYLSPGVHIVKVKEIKQGLSAAKQSPYVEITVVDTNGQTCTQQYYLTTTVGEGKKTSAWAISRDAILQLITAIMGVTDEVAKTKLVGINDENIASKLSAFMVGKPFAIHIAGKWVNPTDATKKSWVKGEFGSGKFATVAAKVTDLKHDPAKHIKGFRADGQGATQSGNIPASTTNW